MTSDANGVLLPGQSYRLSAAAPDMTLTSNRGATNPNGMASTTLRSAYAGVQPVRASFGTTVLNANLLVTAKSALCPNGAPIVRGQPWLYNTAWNPRRLVLSDLTGDGYLDIAFTSQTGTAFFVVLVNDGNGRFPKASQTSASGYQYGIAAADVNGDGLKDILTTSNDRNWINVFTGAGNGNFTLLKTIAVGSSPGDMVVADFDGDSIADLAVTNTASSSVSLLWNNGNANFTMTSLTTDASPQGLAHGFIDSDTNRDLVVACASTSGYGVNVFFNQGSRTFATKSNYLPGVASNNVSVGDINGDGYVDFAVSAQQQNGLLTYLCSAGGSCSLNGNYRTNNGSPTSIALYDVNHDGNIDILQGQGGSARTQLFINMGGGQMQSATFFAGAPSVQDIGVFTPGNDNAAILVSSHSGGSIGLIGNLGDLGLHKYSVSAGGVLYPRDFAVADFNGDGAIDIFVANFYQPCALYMGVPGGNIAFNATPSASISLSGTGYAAQAADVNGDGNIDILTTTGAPTLDVLLNRGSGIFASPKSIGLSSGADFFRAVDWDNDGFVDVLVRSNAGIAIYTGSGDGNFSYALTGNMPTPTAIAVADFDLDGAMDVSLLNTGNNNMLIFFGKGDGTIARTYSLALSSGGYGLTALDLSGDGYPDLAAFLTNNTGAMLINQGNSTFVIKQTLPAVGTARTVDAIDFTGDGRADLVTASLGEFAVGMYTNLGDGTVALPSRFTGPVGDLVSLHTYTAPALTKPIIFVAGDTDQAVVYMQSTGCQ